MTCTEGLTVSHKVAMELEELSEFYSVIKGS